MTTYKDDDSFFNCIVIPVNRGYSTINHWFYNHDARYRYINDVEANQDFLTLKDRDELYPNIRSIAVVMNPWARVLYAYKANVLKSKNGIVTPLSLLLDLTSFESFVYSITKVDLRSISPSWFTIDTPQMRWIEYDDRRADYILKFENLEEDFQPIRDYFCTDTPLYCQDPPIDYRESYNDTTKNIVYDMFHEDAERLNYEF